MKKGIMVLIIATACSIAFAAVTVTITVPDAYTAQVLSAMNTLAGTHMTLEARGSSPDPANDFDGRCDFRIEPKAPSETNVQFAKRFTQELLIVSVKVVKSQQENKRYRDEVSKVAPPNPVVPNDVVQ